MMLLLFLPLKVFATVSTTPTVVGGAVPPISEDRVIETCLRAVAQSGVYLLSAPYSRAIASFVVIRKTR